MKDNLYIKASVKDGQLHFPIKLWEPSIENSLNNLKKDLN